MFLLDDSRISEIHLVSGRTKKKTPKLQPLLQSVVTMSASQDGKGCEICDKSPLLLCLTVLFAGVWLAGLLLSGELFLWNKDRDSLKTVSAVPEVHQLLSSVPGLCESSYSCFF